MSNHVKNVLIFRNLKKSDVDFIVNTICEDTPEPIIDFGKIIPEPRVKEDCPEECLVNTTSHVEEDKERPWFDWYTWRNLHWGTKWNAYDPYTEQGKSWVRFVFSTAWSMPEPIIDRLALLGFDFTVEYADEDYGSNCGIISYNASEHTWDIQTEDELKAKGTNPSAFARHLWDKY